MTRLLPLLLLSCSPAVSDKQPSESLPPGETGAIGETGETDETDGTDTVPDETAPPAVILFVGDGMGPQHVVGGGLYANGAAGSLTMETLPYQGRLRTASLSGITDSAAAATAYATGEKTWNRRLGLDRDEVELLNLAEMARARGLSVGIVSTDTLTGATPAGFLVHTRSRGDTDEIAAQTVADLPDVLLGGGSGVLAPLLTGADVQLATTAADLLAANVEDRPLVGLFAEEEMPWVADGLGDAPTIAQMTEAALSHLEGSPTGFFLMVEGARIDHASHGNREDRVHPETAAFDEAIAAAMAWAEGREEVTLLVTADHETGGMTVAETGAAGEIPETSWRWKQHTNADVPVFGMGDLASLFDGQRLDALWVHEVLAAAIESRPVEDPHVVSLVDGWLDDVGEAVVTQTWETSFGAGYNQLDALRLYAGTDGLRIGVDGAFELDDNAVVILLDVDYGEGTGLGASDTEIDDSDGAVESVLSTLEISVELDGLGFDLAIASLGANEVAIEDFEDTSGLRGLAEPWVNDESDLWWLNAAVNVDDGNVAINGEAASDAAAPGLTEHGLEAWVPWEVLWSDGVADTGLRLGVVVLLVDADGDYTSNQALPPLTDAAEPGEDEVAIRSAVVLEVDGDGVAVGAPAVVE